MMVRQVSFRMRIIPADAGSTAAGRHRSAGQADHPRGCGEHRRHRLLPGIYEGSSPRMRGARRDPLPAAQGMGIIPADAGSTGRQGRPQGPAEDHPRGCGEHTSSTPTSRLPRGSSPRMRGARAMRGKLPGGLGIIPADAGSTTSIPKRYSRHTDHPRGCGEHLG